MPTKKPRGAELTLEQHRANQVLHQRRLRIEHVTSGVKWCRIVKARIRLWKEGVRDLVMERCCVLHTFRVRLTLWQPMVEAGYTPGNNVVKECPASLARQAWSVRRTCC